MNITIDATVNRLVISTMYIHLKITEINVCLEVFPPAPFLPSGGVPPGTSCKLGTTGHYRGVVQYEYPKYQTYYD